MNIPLNTQDFPVSWGNPADADKFWQQDAMHAPKPITPVTQVIGGTYIANGFTEGFRQYSIPLEVNVIFQNGYYYMAMTPLALSHSELAELEKQSQEKCEQAVIDYRDLWENKWFPEVQEHTRFIEDFDVENTSLDSLTAHFKESLVRIKRLWVIHFTNVVPMVLAPSLFEETYRDLFDDLTTFEALELLQGLENHSTVSGLEIWKLSRLATQNEAVAATFDTHDAADVWEELSGNPACEAFVEQVKRFLHQHGKMNEHYIELNGPTWLEDPAPVMNSIQSYIKNPDTRLDETQAELAQKRETQTTHALQQLENFPESIRRHFKTLLDAAQLACQVQEDHNYYLDQQIIHGSRRLLMALGRQFVARTLMNEPEDIFFLYPDEIIATASETIDRRPLIVDRRETYANYQALLAPPVLGKQPEGPPPDTPFNRAVGKFFGAPPSKPESSNEWIGNAASPGKATGRAVVIHSLSEADRLQEGDIMVTRTTNPSWAPLFGTLAAVVTDTGGVLCHCAIVAREYNLPAVIGLGTATMSIEDGAMIEVDGTNGIVKLVDAG